MRVGEREPVVIQRTEGYTGILIEDLVSKGADEPYRMFTSRAEFRLHLRIDNADQRLTPLGRKMGLVDDSRWARFEEKESQKQNLRAFFAVSPAKAAWLRRPESKIVDLGLGGDFIRGVLATVETEIKYAGYISQQERQVKHLSESERRPIPGDFSYSDLPGLSREVQEKLQRVRPETLGQAGKIPGVTPAAIAVLDVYLSLSVRNERV
jgi:tRNA uridine 5-carboxymethylaminomethyl modification enzyme